VCDFCRHDVPLEPVTVEHEGRTYEFCSEACRDELAANDFVFSEYHGYRLFDTQVSALDQHLPQGMPRNSFVLLSAMAGTRDGAVHAELVWRTLQREEPAAVVTFKEPPVATVQRFLSLGWNILPYLERGDLRIVDCFTYRVDDRERMFDRMNRWNTHLQEVARPAIETVRDATDITEIGNKLDNCLEACDMTDRGAVMIDSLTELGSLVQPVQAYNFVKDLRADVCKGRDVPVFVGATYSGDDGAFPHDLDYVVDGVVQLVLDGELVEDTLIKRIRIRKMSGVLAISEWTAYEYTSELGMVTFDPEEEIEKSKRQRGESSASTDGDADTDPPDAAESDGDPPDGAAADRAADADGTPTPGATSSPDEES